MKRRLTTCSIEYLSILFVIWQLVDYYGKLFQVDAGENPAKIITQILEKDGITYLRMSFPKIDYVPYGKTVFKIKRVYNEYLRYALLPEQNILRPYSAGSDITDIMEPLYIEMVTENETYINIDVVYVDNMEAYNHVKKDEEKGA